MNTISMIMLIEELYTYTSPSYSRQRVGNPPSLIDLTCHLRLSQNAQGQIGAASGAVRLGCRLPNRLWGA